MRRLSLGIGLLLAMATISQPSLSATDDNPLSAYTKQLVDLMSQWADLNKAVATRMAHNDRVLLGQGYASPVERILFAQSWKGSLRCSH